MAPRKEPKISKGRPSKVANAASPRVAKNHPPASSRPRARTTTAVFSARTSKAPSYNPNGANTTVAVNPSSIVKTDPTPQAARQKAFGGLQHASQASARDERTLTGPAFSLSLPPIGEHSTVSEVTDFLRAVADYFKHLQVVRDGPTSFFQDMNAIIDRMEDFACLPLAIRSSARVSDTLMICLKRYKRVVSLWTRAVHKALSDQMLSLHALRSSLPELSTESRFTSLLADIRAVSTPPAFGSPATSTDDLPVIVSPKGAEDVRLVCDQLHHHFQDAIYTTETTLLWLLVWRSLKAAFTAYQNKRFKGLPANSSVEMSFFSNARIERRLRALVQSPDAANPREIEEMVGQYCRFVAECRENPDDAFAHLHGLRDQPLKDHVLASLNKFIQTRTVERSTLQKLHFAVIRLNAMTGGPKALRRWKEAAPTGEEKQDAQGRNILHASTVSHGPEKPVRASENGTEGQADGLNRAVPRPRRTFPHPDGLNRRSAFDYVWYPFPETRPHEVAQNEQISREMAEQEIHSDGPRVAFLVNQPPRHARNPATVSWFTSSRELGPLGWLGLVLQKHLSKRRRRVARSSTSSAPPSTTTVLGQNARIHKSTASMSRLRGGAGMAVDPFRKPLPPRPSGRTPFDPTRFRTEHIERFKDAWRKSGNNVDDLDEKTILSSLEQSCWDIFTAIQEYQKGGANQYGGDPGPSNLARPDRQSDGGRGHGPLQPLSAGHQRVPRGAAPSPSQGGRDQGPLQPLSAPYQRAPRGAAPSPSSEGNTGRGRGRSNDTNQENNTPPAESGSSDDQLLVPCHPCPVYPGEYHHNCHCQFEIIDPEEIENDTDLADDAADDAQDDAQGAAAGEQDADADQDADLNLRDDSPDVPPRGREQIHPQDEEIAGNMFDDDSDLYYNLNDATDALAALRRLIDEQDISLWETDPAMRDEVYREILRLREAAGVMRSTYLGALDPSVPVYVIKIPDLERLRFNPALPSSPALCRRTFLEMVRCFDRVLDMRKPGLEYTNLGFRHAINRFLRSVRELTRLFEEYALRLDNAAVAEQVESTDSESLLSDDEKQRVAQYNGPTPRQAPRREDYELMFKNELERELLQVRQFPVNELPNRYTKDFLIQKLMDLDQGGRYGQGAVNCYRGLEQQAGARNRPRGWDLSAAIERARNTRKALRSAMRKHQGGERKRKRRAQGLDSSVDHGETPDQFTDDVDESSGYFVVVSEEESTRTMSTQKGLI
ncbi:hypothetical protein ABEF95_015436 [Exophiala dermatitidis]